VKGAGGSGLIVPIDMLDDASMAAAVNRVQSDGPLDILVNNAGIMQTARLIEHTTEEITRLYTVNTTAPVQLTSMFLPGMIQRGKGQIINHASVAAIGMPGSAVYSSTKAALLTFSEALRRELRGTGVRVCTLLTPVVATDMSRASEHVRRERGWYRSSRAVQQIWTMDHYMNAIFPKLEQGQPVIAPGIAAWLTRCQRFAPRLVDFGLTLVFRPMYGEK
jgi:short-subunit dehydrogenase